MKKSWSRSGGGGSIPFEYFGEGNERQPHILGEYQVDYLDSRGDRVSSLDAGYTATDEGTARKVESFSVITALINFQVDIT